MKFIERNRKLQLLNEGKVTIEISLSYKTCVCMHEVHIFGVVAVCFLTTEGRGVCYKAPPPAQAWLQSHICSLEPPHLHSGQYTE